MPEQSLLAKTYTVAVSGILMLLAAPISAAQSQLQEMPQVIEEPQATALTPAVLPPEPPLRPQFPLVEKLPHIGDPSTAVKEPLNWRALADKLVDAVTPNCRSANAPYSETLMALLASAPEAGLIVDSLNSNAGHVLTKAKDAPQSIKIVIVLSEMPPGTTVVKAAPIGEMKASKQRAIDLLFERFQSTISKRGSI